MALFDNKNSGLLGMYPGSYAAGEAEGYLMGRENARAENADARAQSDQLMEEETFGWQREQYQRQKIIQEGMAQAAEAGGYEGTIAFLEKNDPERAIAFTKSKLSLDQDIMSNDVMKATSKFKINEAMVESYGLLGKMGYALLQAPPEHRDAIYQQMLPMVKKINPNAPGDVVSAAPMFLLAAAQAAPANLLFKAEKETLSAKSELGKLDLDIRARMKKGLTPENDKGLAAMMAKRNESMHKLTMGQVNMNKAQLGVAKDKLQATETVNKNLLLASKDWVGFSTNYLAVSSALHTLQKDPKNPQAQSMLQRKVAREFSGGGTMNDLDIEAALSAIGFSALGKKFRSMKEGRIEYLDPTEIATTATLLDQYKEEKLSHQKQIESQFEDSVVQYNSNNPNGDIIDLETIRKPSTAYLKGAEASANIETIHTGNIPPELQSWADYSIKKGADPKVIQERLMQMAQQGKQEGENQ